MGSKGGLAAILDLTPLQRILLRIEVRGADECWRYRGDLNNHGYGRLDYRTPSGSRVKIMAHRAVLEMSEGPMPAEVESLHSCDNPPCCNPAHLKPGTHRQNMLEAKERGRMGRRPGMRLVDKLPCIQAFVAAGVQQRTIARWFQVTPQAINIHLKGKQ